jgi:GATA-binding protein, other eukaryote
VSRTTTPAAHHASNIAPQHLFDQGTLAEHAFNVSPSLPALSHLRHPSPGSTSSLNDRHLEPPHSYETLQQQNINYKTRISELEVINELFRGRVQQLEENEARNKETQDQLKLAIEQAQNRENILKRRLEDLEKEMADLKESSPPRAKRPRLSEATEYPDPQPLPAAT